METPIVFLDVDGVLVHQHYENQDTCDIHPDKVRLLKHICDTTHASVVIISSWRGGTDWTPNMYHVLRQILADADIPVLGDAPHIDGELLHAKDKPRVSGTIEELTHDYTFAYGTGRAAEVQAYLKEHPTPSFVILDDEDWCWKDYGYHTHWVRPSWFVDALTEQHAEQAIRILQHKMEVTT